jgi:hypothetical protein
MIKHLRKNTLTLARRSLSVIDRWASSLERLRLRLLARNDQADAIDNGFRWAPENVLEDETECLDARDWDRNESLEGLAGVDQNFDEEARIITVVLRFRLPDGA